MKFISAFADTKHRAELFAEYLVDHNATVRSTALHFGISKSTVHKDLTQQLKNINPTLYAQAKHILLKNKAERHIRGGEATKRKYGKKTPTLPA